MKPTERDTKIYANLLKMCEMAREQGESTTSCEAALSNIVMAKEPSYREVLLCIIVQMMLDSTLKASEKWSSFTARGIYDNGPVKGTMIVNYQKLTERLLLYFGDRSTLSEKEISAMKLDIKSHRQLLDMEDVDVLLNDAIDE